MAAPAASKNQAGRPSRAQGTSGRAASADRPCRCGNRWCAVVRFPAACIPGTRSLARPAVATAHTAVLYTPPVNDLRTWGLHTFYLPSWPLLWHSQERPLNASEAAPGFPGRASPPTEGRWAPARRGAWSAAELQLACRADELCRLAAPLCTQAGLARATGSVVRPGAPAGRVATADTLRCSPAGRGRRHHTAQRRRKTSRGGVAA